MNVHTCKFIPTHPAQQTTCPLTHTHTLTITHNPSIAPGDYGALTDFSLGPFSNSVRQLSFNVSIVNDVILDPEDETFTASLALAPADRARLGTRVTVNPDLATVTILDDEGTISNVVCVPLGYVTTYYDCM